MQFNDCIYQLKCQINSIQKRRSNFGQDKRDHYLSTTECDDQLVKDVHPSELFAALEESVSSISGSEDSGVDNWDTASEGGSGIGNDQESTEDVWGNKDAAFVPDSPNVGNSADQIGKLDSEVCGAFGSPDCTDDSEATLTDVSRGLSDFNDESDSEEDLEAILARELLEELKGWPT